jgi:hypothetical protein
MSLIDQYNEKKTVFTPPANQTTYEQFVFNMERNGTNDLVERNLVDPTFRPPDTNDTYIAANFKNSLV